MPNWITNTIAISGDTSVVKQVLEFLKTPNSAVDFKHIDKDFVRVDPDPNVTCVPFVEGDDDFGIIYVETAWRSPDVELVEISKRFPDCSFSMESGDGNDIWYFKVTDGKIVEGVTSLG